MTTPAALRELADCPCGRPAMISAVDSAGRRSAHCDDEDCYWSIVGFTDEDVTERWNRRSQLRTAASEGGEAVGEIADVFHCRYSRVVLFNSDLPKGTKLFTHPPEVARDAGLVDWRALWAIERTMRLMDCGLSKEAATNAMQQEERAMQQAATSDAALRAREVG